MNARPRVGLLGGTFDPIHLGHIAVVRTAEQALELDHVKFIPSAHPPHRTDSPLASGYHRLEMIRLAIAEAADGAAVRWEPSDLELRREGSSYSFDTLCALHSEGLTPLQIFFLTGTDAFAEIATWHRYPKVLDLAHFVVVRRPGTTVDDLRHRLPSLESRMIGPSEVAAASTPGVILLNADTPDVSSTDLRRRAARGESLEDLVPSSVAAYITQHSLYRAAFTSPKPTGEGGPDAPGA